MIMLKLIEAKRFGDGNTNNIEGTVEEFKEWFLGKEKAKKLDDSTIHSTSIKCGSQRN